MAADDSTVSSPAGPFPLPTVLTYPSSTAPELVTQGAEGRVYRTTYLEPGLACALKHRPAKPYRHPALDARLTRQRLLAEARILQRCRRDGGVAVPAVYAVLDGQGCLMMEGIDGGPVRARLNDWLASRRRPPVAVVAGAVERTADTADAPAASAASAFEDVEDVENLSSDPALRALMSRIGRAVAGLHGVGVVHGDLTTSNMMLRQQSSARRANGEGQGQGQGQGQEQEQGQGQRGEGGKGEADDGDSRDDHLQQHLLDGEIVVIDFGLASQSTSDEDRAVDLYVLERAFASSHPRAEPLFGSVLDAYRAAFKQAKPVLRKLEEVRMRGRKRSMLG